MKERIEYLLEIFIDEKNKDIQKRIDNFEEITNTLFTLTQSLFDNNEKIKYHQRELEGKYFRFGLANQSLINLIKGNKFKLINIDAHFVDIFSLNSITRMQIESYLIIFYLIFDKISDSEKDFRYDIYKLHGLQKQLDFKITHQTNKKSEQQNKIKKELNETISNIKCSKIYIDSIDKEKYLNPKYAKIVKSDILFKNSGLKNSRIDDIWKIYSNHAHSEHISDRQYNTVYKINKNAFDNCSLIITINTILTAKLILFLKDAFNGCERKYNELSLKEQVQVETWGIKT